MNYEAALVNAWEHLLKWAKEGKFRPTNEEDIQCFLYHGLVMELGTAVGIKPKPTITRAEKKGLGGPVKSGDMHFPDLTLGDNEVVVEIKFARGGLVPYQKCKDDILKMNAHHLGACRYFLLYDSSPNHVFLDHFQLEELKQLARLDCSEGMECRVLYYPQDLNPSPVKQRGRKAWDTMRCKGNAQNADGVGEPSEAPPSN
jgi:hypothetical protein